MLPFRRRTTVTYADPLRAGRHPFQTYLLFLCAISGIPLAFGVKTAGSVEALLPEWAALTWGLCLAGGSVLGLTGSYWPKRHYATALTVERIGLLIVGPAALLYSVLIAIYIGFSGTVTVLIVAAFGFSALLRAHDIGLIIVRAIESNDEDELPGVVRREGEGESEALLREDEAP